MSQKSRDALTDVASQILALAAEASVRAMSYAQQSARIGQLATVCGDDEVDTCLAVLIAEGMVDWDGAKYVFVENDEGEPHASLDIRITAEGGES
jgi:hypothetical protein